jgi:hypothetical protein
MNTGHSTVFILGLFALWVHVGRRKHELGLGSGSTPGSRDLYARAFERAKDDYYTRINAASKSVLLGTPEDLERAKSYAKLVQQIVGTEPHEDDYWNCNRRGGFSLNAAVR